MTDNPTRVVANIGVRNRALWLEFLGAAERIGIPQSVALERGARLWLDSVWLDSVSAPFVDPLPVPHAAESE